MGRRRTPGWSSRRRPCAAVHQVPAVLLGDAQPALDRTDASRRFVGNRGYVPVRWSAAGSDHTGVVSTDPDAQAGQTINVTVGADGNLADTIKLGQTVVTPLAKKVFRCCEEHDTAGSGPPSFMPVPHKAGTIPRLPPHIPQRPRNAIRCIAYTFANSWSSRPTVGATPPKRTNATGPLTNSQVGRRQP